MPADFKHYYKQPEPDTEYEDLEKMEPRSIGTCCICNTNASLCVPERASSSYITSVYAHTVSYWFN